VLRTPEARRALDLLGREPVTTAIRAELEVVRQATRAGARLATIAEVSERAVERAMREAQPSQRVVFNLTGTILHTNLGRALLADEACAAALSAMREPTNLEFDLESGRRGERDDHVAALVRELTGAEDAIVVNNNAAALVLTLHALARRREVVVSRGELVEIGGSFRLPEIMASAGARLREIGTTNRTHAADYAAAIGPRTALVLKVHTSNFVVEGFASAVPHREVAAIARRQQVPFVDDLGSGALLELGSLGIRGERSLQDALRDGADLVTCSGDKLLGGPQAGLIVGRTELIKRLKRDPLRRAVRADKIRLAALEATLRLYRDRERLAQRLPTLRFVTRPQSAIREVATATQPEVAKALGAGWRVSVVDCESEVGSGSLPGAVIASAGLAITPAGRRGAGGAIERLGRALRRLPRPVIGRVKGGALLLDLRCLDAPEPFVAQLPLLTVTWLRSR
jgi:L-seryl-tRNA(Ser) seleniumtransferase